METTRLKPDRLTLKRAWAKLCSSGAATRDVVRILQVGLDRYLDIFAGKYLGEEAIGGVMKLVLGANGEGKTHLLLCLRQRALAAGHVVALVDARTAGISASSLTFARHVLASLEESGLVTEGLDAPPSLLALLRSAVDHKRGALESDGLDPADLLPQWADGFKLKPYHPNGFGQALADAIHAIIAGDLERAQAGAIAMSMPGLRVGKAEQESVGGQLLRSIARLVADLGFRPLVLLVDEAETSVEKAGSASRRSFYVFLRHLDDHVAQDERHPAIVLVACTDDLWPARFNEYTALKQRLSDPGLDAVEQRANVSMKALVNKNKLWVREVFRGTEADYEALGAAILGLAKEVLEGIDDGVQASNARRLGRIASSSMVAPHVKRYFVKALAQTIEDQLADERQVVLSEEEAGRCFDRAVDAIQEADAKVESTTGSSDRAE